LAVFFAMVVQQIFDWFREQSLATWVIFSLVSNFAISGSSIVACWWLGRMFPKRQIFDSPQPLTAHDKWLAILATLLNSGVSIAGWILWKAGWITITFPSWERTLLDVIILLLFMDVGMYVLHWVVHYPALFRVIHRTHHTHHSTNPLSLFVLNPLEVLGFGSLMICGIFLFPLSAIAIVIYLNLNIAFGTLGHAGVEPFPSRWFRHAVFRQIGTSTFHGLHHADPQYNFGFYTAIWDRVFGTIHPEYDRRVAQEPGPDSLTAH